MYHQHLYDWIEVEDQLQPLYFDQNKIQKSCFQAPKWHIGVEGGVGLGIFYM